jgi:hypothetical protein
VARQGRERLGRLPHPIPLWHGGQAGAGLGCVLANRCVGASLPIASVTASPPSPFDVSSDARTYVVRHTLQIGIGNLR